jgi:hypothetical protein
MQMKPPVHKSGIFAIQLPPARTHSITP